jgi:hypothetical protein
MNDYYVVPKAALDATADAVRKKLGSEADIEFKQNGFEDAVDAIETGGGYTVEDVVTATGIAGDIEITNASVVEYCLAGRTGITGLSLPNMVTGSPEAFRGCRNIASINAPELVTGKSHMFYGSFARDIAVHFPKLSNFGGTGMFEGAGFKIGVFPAATNLYGYAFMNSSAIKAIDLGPNLETISGTQNFRGTSVRHGLETLILRNSTRVVSLGNISSFTKSQFDSDGEGGTIYIPKALYDHLGDGTSLDYRAATNWSTIDGYGTITWAQIEGSIYETQYADGTPIE